MPKLFITDLSGSTIEFNAKKGISVMEAIKDAGSDDLAAICGGVCSCATCHVFVEGEWYAKTGAMTGDELELVSETEYYREGASRLSCQIKLNDELDGLRVTIAPEG